MSVPINLSSDLNNYLKSSGSSINGHSSSGLNGWFGEKSKDKQGWFNYQLLSTSADDEHGSQETISNSGSWFGSLVGPKEPQGCLPTLSRTQRFIGFIALMIMGITCFVLSSFYIPLLLFKARKFAILFTFGSIFVVSSFAVLLGPVNHLKHQFSRERLPFTGAYFSSLAATLYFALEVQSTILTSIFAIIQVVALIWYVVTYIPGGQSGLMFFSRVAASTVSKTLPV